MTRSRTPKQIHQQIVGAVISTIQDTDLTLRQASTIAAEIMETLSGITASELAQVRHLFNDVSKVEFEDETN